MHPYMCSLLVFSCAWEMCGHGGPCAPCHLSARRRRCLPPGARTSIGTRRPGRPKLLRIPTSPTTLWGLRVRQDGERGQGGVTLGRSAGGRVVGAMERVLCEAAAKKGLL